MNLSDAINGGFELVGGLLLWRNCVQLWRDREVKGVRVTSTAFFMAWGYWNLLFYPANGLWMSWVGGVVLVVANTVWVGMAVWFGRRRPLAPVLRRCRGVLRTALYDTSSDLDRPERRLDRRLISELDRELIALIPNPPKNSRHGDVAA